MLFFAHETGNRFRNIDYLLACPVTGSALAVDPWEAAPLVQEADRRGWRIEAILNTHTHHDHTHGNRALQDLTGAPILVHPDAVGDVDGEVRGVNFERGLDVGQSHLDVLDTPGHTMSHICLISRSEPGFLVAGDTLFHAGAGNCHNGGHPDVLFETFRDHLWSLPKDLLLLPGHDYRARNLAFAVDREPGNSSIVRRLNEAESGPVGPTTLEDEHNSNPFFRLDQPGVISTLQSSFPERDLSSQRSRFLAMRELRNRW